MSHDVECTCQFCIEQLQYDMNACLHTHACVYTHLLVEVRQISGTCRTSLTAPPAIMCTQVAEDQDPVSTHLMPPYPLPSIHRSPPLWFTYTSPNPKPAGRHQSVCLHLVVDSALPPGCSCEHPHSARPLSIPLGLHTCRRLLTLPLGLHTCWLSLTLPLGSPLPPRGATVLSTRTAWSV